MSSTGLKFFYPSKKLRRLSYCFPRMRLRQGRQSSEKVESFLRGCSTPHARHGRATSAGGADTGCTASPRRLVAAATLADLAGRALVVQANRVAVVVDERAARLAGQAQVRQRRRDDADPAGSHAVTPIRIVVAGKPRALVLAPVDDRVTLADALVTDDRVARHAQMIPSTLLALDDRTPALRIVVAHGPRRLVQVRHTKRVPPLLLPLGEPVGVGPLDQYVARQLRRARRVNVCSHSH